jgi:hypothetical protein
LKDEIKKKSIKKDLKKPRLTGQTCNPDHMTEITSWNANQNKLQIAIPNQPNIEGQD